MHRFLALIISGISFFVFTSFFQQRDVKVTIDMPETIEAGTSITVNVTIQKGKASGFARFQQELPYGFTAAPINSANADFGFQDQKVRLIWLSLPSDETITASYHIIANERIKGNINLNGRFSYIDNNDRKYVDAMNVALSITPSPSIDPLLVVDIRDYPKIAKSQETYNSTITCIQQDPVWVADQKVFLVTLLVNKGNLQGFARIEETIPDGYTAVATDSKGATFTNVGNTVRFVWMNPPVDPYFTVTYKLQPKPGTVVNPATMKVAGTFSYTDGDKAVSSAVVSTKETLIGLSQSQVNRLIASSSQSSAPVTVASLERPSTPATQRPTTTNNSAQSIYYRVQIAAGHKPLNPQQHFRKYKLGYTVMREEHNGWYKYSVGPFKEYKDARDYRVRISKLDGLDGPFIAAYNNGRRITVQEALMALNQKWYR